MKNLILLFSFSILFSVQSNPARAQDVFGRGKNTDTTYLDANNFNHGESIMVDTTGGKHFVGSTLTGLPYKLFLIYIVHGPGAPMLVTTVYNNTGATISSIDTSEAGVYIFTFSTNIFSGKKVMVLNDLILGKDEFTEQTYQIGYFWQQQGIASRYSVGNPITMYAVDIDGTTLLDHGLGRGVYLEIQIYN